MPRTTWLEVLQARRVSDAGHTMNTRLSALVLSTPDDRMWPVQGKEELRART